MFCMHDSVKQTKMHVSACRNCINSKEAVSFHDKRSSSDCTALSKKHSFDKTREAVTLDDEKKSLQQATLCSAVKILFRAKHEPKHHRPQTKHPRTSCTKISNSNAASIWLMHWPRSTGTPRGKLDFVSSLSVLHTWSLCVERGAVVRATKQKLA